MTATFQSQTEATEDGMSYVRVGILGTTSGGEVWSVNPVFDPTGEIEGSVDQTALDTAALAIANLSPGTNLLLNFDSQMTITGARVEVRADATDDLIAISTQVATTPHSGTGSMHMPPQAALVFSLRTNTPGARGRGRIYWPATAVALTTNYLVSGATVTGVSNDFKTYMHAIEGLLAAAFPTIGFNLAVRSKVAKASPHVVRIQTGNRPDTQRRRRDHLPEAYVSLTY